MTIILRIRPEETHAGKKRDEHVMSSVYINQIIVRHAREGVIVPAGLFEGFTQPHHRVVLSVLGRDFTEIHDRVTLKGDRVTIADVLLDLVQES